MEPIFYEVRPYLFLFAGLKAFAADSPYPQLLFMSGLLLTIAAVQILVKRWATRGYFGLRTAHAARRRSA